MSRYFRRDRDNPNTFIGIILLIVLGVFVGPNMFPQFLSDLSPYIFAGVPCGRLPSANNLAAHQSVIGRSVENPLVLELVPSAISAEGTMIIRLTVTNVSLGTVPLIYDATDVVTVDDNSNGFGIVINPPTATGGIGRRAAGLTSYPEDNIKMLGPRQKCVHSFEVRPSQGMINSGGTAQAFYRVNTAGTNQPQDPGTRTIYPDQGLDILTSGVIFSDVVQIQPYQP